MSSVDRKCFLWHFYRRGLAKKEKKDSNKGWVTSAVNTLPPSIRTLAEVKIKWFDLKEMVKKNKNAALQHKKKSCERCHTARQISEFLQGHSSRWDDASLDISNPIYKEREKVIAILIFYPYYNKYSTYQGYILFCKLSLHHRLWSLVTTEAAR